MLEHKHKDMQDAMVNEWYSMISCNTMDENMVRFEKIWELRKFTGQGAWIITILYNVTSDHMKTYNIIVKWPEMTWAKSSEVYISTSYALRLLKNCREAHSWILNRSSLIDTWYKLQNGQTRAQKCSKYLKMGRYSKRSKSGCSSAPLVLHQRPEADHQPEIMSHGS